MNQLPQREAHKIIAKKTKDEKLPNQPETVIEEIGGPEGPEPTRYGDWEKKGRCIDF